MCFEYKCISLARADIISEKFVEKSLITVISTTICAKTDEFIDRFWKFTNVVSQTNCFYFVHICNLNRCTVWGDPGLDVLHCCCKYILTDPKIRLTTKLTDFAYKNCICNYYFMIQSKGCF